MRFLKIWIRKVASDVLRPEMEAAAKELLTRVASIGSTADLACKRAQNAVDEVKSLRKQMAAAQALDVGFQESGKLIVLSRIGDQDRVKIIDIKPTLTLAEYRTLVDRIKEDFGVGDPNWVDAPPGIAERFEHYVLPRGR